MRLLAILAALCISVSLHAQAPQPRVAITGVFYDTTMLIRVQPEDYRSWQSLMQGESYYVYREMIEEDGVELDSASRAATRVYVASQLWPDSLYLEQLILEGVDTNYVYAAIGAVFDSIELDIESDNPYVKFKANKNADEDRFFAVSMASAYDFRLCLGLGLGFRDYTPLTGSGYGTRYLYTLYPSLPNGLPNEEKLLAATVIEAAPDTTLLPDITDIKVVGEDGSSMISISKNYENSYVGYKIWRADGVSGTFNELNGGALYAGLSSSDQQSFNFVDSNLTIGQTYAYKVAGINSYGMESNQSDSIQIVVLASPLMAYPVIDSVDIVNAATYRVHWTFPGEHVSRIDRIDLLRGNSSSGDFTLVKSVSEDSVGTILDTFSFSCYYKLQAHDINGYDLPSIAFMIQRPDTIPPVAPTLLEANGTKQNTINVIWQRPSEIDINRYSVYFCNKSDGEYAEVSASYTSDTSMSFDYDMRSLQKLIYIKMRAVDNNENYSRLSAYKQVLLPDIVPPMPPTINRPDELPGSVRVNWVESQSDDVVKHYIQRRPILDQSWVNISVVNATPGSPNPAAQSFLDSVLTSGEDYVYRIQAEDGGGNRSVSNTLNARPLPGGAPADCVGTMSQGEYNSTGNYNLMKGGYPPACGTLQQVRIYRSVGNRQMTLLTTFDLSDDAGNDDIEFGSYFFYFYDREILKGHILPYKYQMQGTTDKGIELPMSTVMIMYGGQ